MSEGSAGTPGGDGAGRRVRKRVRVRVEQPVPWRHRVKKAWARHRRWLTPALLVVLGLAAIWLALVLGVRDE
jgi:hypothetical protein